MKLRKLYALLIVLCSCGNSFETKEGGDGIDGTRPVDGEENAALFLQNATIIFIYYI